MPFKLLLLPIDQVKQTTKNGYNLCITCNKELTSDYDIKHDRDEHSHCRQSRLRRQIIKQLGGVCINCGFSDIRALQIDHKNGGGVKELKITGRLAYYYRILGELNAGIIRFQLLCANCNWIKRHENNENPVYNRSK